MGAGKEYQGVREGIEEVSSDAGPTSLIYYWVCKYQGIYVVHEERGRRTIGGAVSVSEVGRLSPHRIRTSAGALCNPHASRFNPPNGTALRCVFHTQRAVTATGMLSDCCTHASTKYVSAWAFVLCEGLLTAE